MQQTVNGISFQLLEPFDFSFLEPYGQVFKVLDDQDSGNICFGTEKDGRRYFIKVAGAKTLRAVITPQEAIDNLKATVPIYQTLRHPALVPFIEEGETDQAFYMVFEWVDAICMGRMYPQQHAEFMALPIETRHSVFETVLDFLAYTNRMGYVAIDFYDGSILYDPESRRTYICDIDCFQRKPYHNTMGRLWGSTRFMSPEEYEKGALIDEVTNVYTLGAVAQALQENQPDEKLNYMVRLTKIDDRAQRLPSLEAARAAWKRTIRNAGKGLVVRDGTILVIELEDSDGTFYIMPGGGQKPGETLPEAVRREVAEETGMLVRATELAFVIEGKKSAAHRVDLVFHCEIEGEAIGVAHQGDVNQVGTAWISLDTLEQEPLYPSRLRRAISEWYRGGNPGIYLGNEDEGDPEV